MPRCSQVGGWDLNSCQFWLKCLPPSASHSGKLEISCMSAPLGQEGASSEGEYLLQALLLVVLVAGVLLGWLVSRLYQWVAQCGRDPTPVSAPRWRSIVLRALRFIRKRRRISLAFSNYRNHPLNQAPTGPSRKPSRRQAGDLLPLEEGPAFRDGSYGR